MKVIQFDGRKMAGAGACSAYGASVGDRVVAILAQLPGGGLTYVDAGAFESTVSVDAQLQQLQVGRHVYDQATQTLTWPDGSTTGLQSLSDRIQVSQDWAQWRFIALLEPAVAMTADGAISLREGAVYLNKAGVLAATIADPAAADEGKVLTVISTTANAHTLSNAAGSGFNAGGASTDVGTFGGAKGDNIVLKAYGTKWLVISSKNVTLG